MAAALRTGGCGRTVAQGQGDAPEGRWQPELWGCPGTAALAAVKGLRRASAALGGGQDRRRETKHRPWMRLQFITRAYSGLSPGACPHYGHPPHRPPTSVPRLGPCLLPRRPGKSSRSVERAGALGITRTLPPAPSPSPGASRRAAPEPAALCLPSPWQPLAALAALPKEQPTRWVGGALGKWGRDSSCGALGQGGIWAEISVEASPGSSCSGRGGAPGPCGGGVQQQQATVQLEASGNTKHSCREPSLTCMFGGLGLGEHCRLGGQRLTQDMECGTG